MESDKLMIPKQKAYLAYFKLSEEREKLQKIQSALKHEGRYDDAMDYGMMAVKVKHCMDIVSKEFNLKFEQ